MSFKGLKIIIVRRDTEMLFFLILNRTHLLSTNHIHEQETMFTSSFGEIKNMSFSGDPTLSLFSSRPYFFPFE